MNELLLEAGRKFARAATVVVVRYPKAWPVLRGLLRAQFDRLAPQWEQIVNEGHLQSLEAALAAVDGAPARALDLGTGTGAGAFVIARRFPAAEVVGADLAPDMVAEATAKLPPDLAGRVRFEVADASRLPYEDGAFDLVVLLNMIPFFDELARVTAPGGAVVVSASRGAETPIYVPPERVRRELAARGFGDFDEIFAGAGSALVARKR